MELAVPPVTGEPIEIDDAAPEGVVQIPSPRRNVVLVGLEPRRIGANVPEVMLVALVVSIVADGANSTPLVLVTVRTPVAARAPSPETGTETRELPSPTRMSPAVATM